MERGIPSKSTLTLEQMPSSQGSWKICGLGSRNQDNEPVTLLVHSGVWRRELFPQSPFSRCRELGSGF